MSPVLQCPDCGERHPLGAVGESHAFACSGCGRSLKVPAQFLVPAPDGTREAAPDVATEGAAEVPFYDASVAVPHLSPRALAGYVPRTVRLVVWLCVVPIGFGLVFVSARAFGFLSQRELEDVFLDSHWGRFWPIARLLPFAALTIAALVHGTVFALSRLRLRRAAHRLVAAGATGAAAAATQRSGAGERRRAGS